MDQIFDKPVLGTVTIDNKKSVGKVVVSHPFSADLEIWSSLKHLQFLL